MPQKTESGGDEVEHAVIATNGCWPKQACGTDSHLHSWDASTATHKDDLIDVSQFELGIAQRALHGHTAPVEQVAAHLLKLGTRQAGLDVLGTVCRGSDEGQANGGVAE